MKNKYFIIKSLEHLQHNVQFRYKDIHAFTKCFEVYTSKEELTGIENFMYKQRQMPVYGFNNIKVFSNKPNWNAGDVNEDFYISEDDLACFSLIEITKESNPEYFL